MKRKNRILTLCLAALLLLLPGCSASATALRYGKTTATANMYRYWASAYKAVFSRNYADYADTDAFWNRALPAGGTVLTYLDALVLENVKRTLVCTELFDKLGLRLEDSVREAVDARLDELEENYADGSRNKFNELLSVYGVNRTILRQIYLMERKVELLKAALFADGGVLALTAADRDDYYEKQYVHVQLILVNDAYRYSLTEDGKYIYDQTTGNYVTEELTEAERAAKAEKIAAVEAALAGGVSFAETMKTYSEADEYYEAEGTYPNGYYLTAATDFIPALTDAAFAMAVGETRRVSTEYGTFFLLREELDAGAYGVSENADFFADFDATVAQAKFLDYLSPMTAEVTVDATIVAAYSLRLVTADYHF